MTYQTRGIKTLSHFWVALFAPLTLQSRMSMCFMAPSFIFLMSASFEITGVLLFSDCFYSRRELRFLV